MTGVSDRPDGRGGGGLARREIWKTYIFWLWGMLGPPRRVGGRYACRWRALEEV